MATLENFTEPDVTEDVTGNLYDHKQEHEGAAAVVDKKWHGWPGESVFRIIIPAQMVGGMIGRKGECIKKLCQETGAHIKVLDAPPGSPERAVLISATEEPDASISPAMDGLLNVHKFLHGIGGESANMTHSDSNVVETRILVPSTQAGSLIGKQGSTIKSIQASSNAAVHVHDELPPFALPDDRMVVIQGEPMAVHKAVELISGFLRKFLLHKSVIPLFEGHMPISHPPMEQTMVPPQSWVHSEGLPPNVGGPVYGGNSQFIPRQHDSFYPPRDIHIEKQPHHGISTYGREAPSIGFNSSSVQQPLSISQVTQHMQILLSYADAVIGPAGSNISYIRRASGATITIQETRGVPGEMTVEITGSATQVQTAQQLIQNYMAEAAGPTPSSGQVQNAMPPADQGYKSYQHGSMYGSPANAGPSYPGGGYSGAGGYGAYGGSYGY